MKLDQLTSFFSRLLFLIAGLTLAAGLLEKIANMADKTLTRHYSPERLLEITVAISILISVLLLRQIRNEVRKT